jgi:hypothetical protein
MTTSVLPQLLEVDSELSAQLTELEAQLQVLQDKRRGIQTVIAMFESGNVSSLEGIAAVVNATQSVATKTKAGRKGAAKKKEASATPAKRGPKAKTAAVKTVAKPSAKAGATKAASKASKAEAKGKAAGSVKTAVKAKTAKTKVTRGRVTETATKATVKASGRAAKSSAAAKKAIAKPAKGVAPKRSGRTANWQRYVQDSYSKAPLPDVIVGVLQAQPNNIFKIADVMTVVFKEDMPKNHFLKARNRVSNILSAGARDGDWFRGRGGTYSVSEKAVKAVG